MYHSRGRVHKITKSRISALDGSLLLMDPNALHSRDLRFPHFSVSPLLAGSICAISTDATAPSDYFTRLKTGESFGSFGSLPDPIQQLASINGPTKVAKSNSTMLSPRRASDLHSDHNRQMNHFTFSNRAST